MPLDLGVAEGAGGRQALVEAVGAGLIPAALADIDMQTRSDGDNLPAPGKLTGAIRTTGGVLSRLQPVEMTIVPHGAPRSGVFLLVEVLNMPSIAANLVFSANATPSDGLFHVVMAGEEYRDAIAHYLQEALVRRDAPLPVPSKPARHVTLQGTSEIHLDDEVLSASPGRVLSMHVDEGALELLA